ncbi:hypothetical protein C8J56DRAFT_1042161 [Mycena floridula]|nr:hypothetical protein C8J56DRAFT_1042161 [Mycena floridula]
MSGSATSIPPDVSRLTAAIFVGNGSNILLLGALIVQCYYYYINFGHKDRKRIRFIALFTFVLEVVQTFLVTRDSYILFCVEWGVPSALLRVGLIWLYIPIMGSLMSLLAQSFWAWRLLLITNVYWIPGLVLLFSLAQFVTGLVTGIKCTLIPNLDVTQLSLVFQPASVWLAGTAVADLIIVAFMFFFISKSQARTEFDDTNALLSKILFITLETGLICATIAVIDLALYLAFGNENWHLATSITLSKIYANCLLVVLNSRKLSSSKEEGPISFSRQVFTGTGGSIPATPSAFRSGKTSGINISVSREIHGDEEALHIPMTDPSSDILFQMKSLPHVEDKESVFP